MIDPAFSRPIDVNRWPDHPEVRQLTETVWQQPAFLALRAPRAGKRGPKPKTRYKDQLCVLLLDLYVAWKEHPQLSIGVGMLRGDWKANSRYNALHLSPAIPDLIHTLERSGLIELAKGSYAGPGAKGNRTTRIRASKALAALFQANTLDSSDLEPLLDQELVVLRNDQNKDIEYDDTEETKQWRGELESYNALLRSVHIDIPSLAEPSVERPITSGALIGQTQRIRIARRDTVIRRIFSRSSWTKSGRFNGGW